MKKSASRFRPIFRRVIWVWVERKQMGVRVVPFLLLLMGLTYAVKRKVWSGEH